MLEMEASAPPHSAAAPATAAPTTAGVRARAKCRESRWKFAAATCLAAVDLLAGGLLSGAGLRRYLVLTLSRLVLLLVAGWLAVASGRGRHSNGHGGRGSRDARASVLPLTAHDQLACAAPPEGQPSGQQAEEALARRRAEMEGLARQRWRADCFMALCFLAVTAESVYAGVQIAEFANMDVGIALSLCATVFCMNCEFQVLRSTVRSFVSEEGVLFPALHEHELHYEPKVSLAVCSLCRQRVGPQTGGYEAFMCKACAGGEAGNARKVFTLCLQCYRKQMAHEDVSEGILRGDKGPKHVPDLTTGQYVYRTFKLTQGFRLNCCAALLCVVIATTATVTLPNYQGKIINTLISASQTSAQEAHDAFASVLFTFVGLSVTCALFNSFQSLTVNVVAKQISLRIRADMFKSLLSQDVAFFDGIMTGQLTSRMTNDVQSVCAPVTVLLNTFLANSIKLAGGIFMCFFTSWKLTMLALTMIGPVIYITGIYAKWSKDINMSIRAAMGDANATATESLKNIRTVRAFSADRVEMMVFQSYLDRAWTSMKKDAFASAGVSAITGYVNFAAGVLVYWYGGSAVLAGTDSQLNIGSLVTFNIYWSMLGNSINSLNGMLNTLVVAASAAKRVYEVIDLEPDIPIDDAEAVPLEEVAPAGRAPTIEFRGVSFTYQMRPDMQVFRSLSFTIPGGSTAAFVGKSGCGKSTTMGLLMRFYDPQAGQVLLEGRPLTSVNLRSFQRRIGLVSQETQVFARSVRDNLTYGLAAEDFDDRSIENAARQANAHEFIVQMDRGYDSLLGEGGSRLSGGQKQRLSIARALLRRPQLLLLDEATSALDSENERQIQEALDAMVAAMSGSCSIVIIAHRLATVMNADKIIVVIDGEVFEQGSHEELMDNGQIYCSLVQKQMARQAEQQRGGQASDSEDEKSGHKGGKGARKGKKKGRGQPLAPPAKAKAEPDFESEPAGDGALPAPRASDTLAQLASASHVVATAEGEKESGKPCGKGWCERKEYLRTASSEERKAWLRRKMERTFRRALCMCSSEEVSDALVQYVNEAMERELGERTGSETDARGQAPDSVSALFRDALGKSGWRSSQGKDTGA